MTHGTHTHGTPGYNFFFMLARSLLLEREEGGHATLGVVVAQGSGLCISLRFSFHRLVLSLYASGMTTFGVPGEYD